MQVCSIRLWDVCFTCFCCLLGANGKRGGGKDWLFSVEFNELREAVQTARKLRKLLWILPMHGAGHSYICPGSDGGSVLTLEMGSFAGAC
jgi:hypothetical protein